MIWNARSVNWGGGVIVTVLVAVLFVSKWIVRHLRNIVMPFALLQSWTNKPWFFYYDDRNWSVMKSFMNETYVVACTRISVSNELVFISLSSRSLLWKWVSTRWLMLWILFGAALSVYDKDTFPFQFQLLVKCNEWWWKVVHLNADLAHRTTITKMYDNVCDNNICNADGCIEWLLAWLLLCCGSCDLPDVISTPKKRQDDGGTDDWTRFTIWVIVLSWTVNAFW